MRWNRSNELVDVQTEIATLKREIRILREACISNERSVTFTGPYSNVHSDHKPQITAIQLIEKLLEKDGLKINVHLVHPVVVELEKK